MIRDSSIDAYKTVLGELSTRQAEVFNFIRERGSVCNLDISSGIQRPINEVTPRVCELRTMKLVVDDGKRPCFTGKKVYFWRVNDQAPARVEFKPLKRSVRVSEDDLFGHSKIDRVLG